MKLSGLLNFAGSYARGAHLDPLGSALHSGPDALEVHIPATLRHVVSVADAVPELRPTTTDVTILRHKTVLYQSFAAIRNIELQNELQGSTLGSAGQDEYAPGAVPCLDSLLHRH